MTLLRDYRHRIIMAGVCLACVLTSAYLILLCGSGVMLSYGHSHSYGWLNGAGPKPYVYRVLVPIIVNTIADLTPQFIKEHIDALSKYPQPGDFPSLLLEYTHSTGRKRLSGFEFKDAYHIYLVLAVMFASLLGYAYGLFSLSRKLYPGNLALACCAAIIGLAMLPPFETNKLKIYDFTQLMMITWCLYALASQRLRLYLLLFALTCLNRETSIFMTIFSMVWFYDTLERKKVFQLFLMQAFLFTLIKLILYCRFMNNASTGTHFLQPTQLAAFVTGYSFQTMADIVLALFLVTYRLSEKPLFLRMALVTLLAVLYPCYFFFCAAGEYRDFFEVFPVLTLLGTHTLFAWSSRYVARPTVAP